MTYLMDATAEEAFYENLTLGLTKILEHSPRVTAVELDKRLPCERMQLSSWEQRHCCILPQDLRQFYLSTDGFKLTWNYEYAGETLKIGYLKINSIAELKRLGGMKTQGDSECPSLLDIEVCHSKGDNRPHFGVKCKIFEMDSCQGNGRVCLVYLDKQDTDSDKREKPKIWLLDRSFEWHYLSDSFTQYFRMMLVHQGLPQWQFRFTPMGLTPFAEQMMMLIAPHLIQSEGPSVVSEWVPDGPFNHLDTSVFKNSRSKSSKKKESKAKGNT